MGPLTSMQPRSRSSALRCVATLGAVAAAVTVAFLPIQPGGRDLTLTEALLNLVAVGLVIAVCWAVRHRRTASQVAWALGPLLTVLAIVELDLLTSDASVAAQIFLFFPTLYGASQLPRAGAVVMAAASVVGEAVVVFSLLPVREAVIDIGYVSAALVATAGILIRSGERQAELVQRLERLAAIDPLTGLATRRVLDEAARSALSGAASVDGTSLILIDVDEFKSINDRFGHPCGDEVLVQLADLLVRSARRDDVVSRLGGDEMALLLPGCSVSDLRRRAEQIVWDVRARTFVLQDGEEVTVSVSVGLAHVPTDATDLQSLYVKADQALYEAKRSGRNRVGSLAADLVTEPAREPRPAR
ncbi:MAG: Diguanylate cyclase protein [Nocardioidaceae bacterium]|nr:Diguanylate cyclase protein [Nocardioidaceae bacterium]